MEHIHLIELMMNNYNLKKDNLKFHKTNYHTTKNKDDYY